MYKLQHFFESVCAPERPQTCVAGAAESPTPAGDTWLGTLHMPTAAPAKEKKRKSLWFSAVITGACKGSSLELCPCKGHTLGCHLPSLCSARLLFA